MRYRHADFDSAPASVLRSEATHAFLHSSCPQDPLLLSNLFCCCFHGSLESDREFDAHWVAYFNKQTFMSGLVSMNGHTCCSLRSDS